MQIEKPEPDRPQRVHLTARDPDNANPSKTITIYHTTPFAVIEEFEKFIESRSAEHGSEAIEQARMISEGSPVTESSSRGSP